MGLIHPGILAGLLAIGLPVAIHFIRSRQYQRVEIGTLRFLRTAIREKSRWRKIENWPLLLARIAVVALLTLLFSRPFFPDREKIDPAELEAVLLVDASGSVSGKAFAAVQSAVRATLAKIPTGAKLTIASFADTVRPLGSDALDSLHAVPGARTDYVRVVNWTIDHLAQSDRRRAQVWLIGDLQRAALPSTPPRLWPANATASVVRVPPPGTWNAAISKVELLTPYAAEEAKAEVTVRISGPAPSTRREVTFALEGQPPQHALAEAGGGPVLFRWKPHGGAGLVRAVVSIASNDAFPDDNQRPFAARFLQPKRLALIESGSPRTPFEAESYFLEKALGVSRTATGQSPFAMQVQPGLGALVNVDALAFCNPSTLAASDAARLADFVKRGGALAFFCGAQTDGNALSAAQANGLFPEKITPVAPSGLLSIDTWDHSHPALRRFDGAERGDLHNVVLRDAFDLEGGADWHVLARLGNGHAALLIRELGQGRILVFSNPLTRAWSDFPTARIFLPLMQEWFSWLTQLDPQNGSAVEMTPGFSEARAPGVYENNARLEVVAPDPQEMDVAVADEITVRRALGLPAEKAESAPPPRVSLPGFRERQNELWPWIAVGLLVLLSLENHLADRGMRRSGAGFQPASSPRTGVPPITSPRDGISSHH